MTRTKSHAVAALALGLTAALGGCASSVGAGDYNRGQVGQINKVEEGVIVSARQVRIQGNQTPIVGGATGAVIGGAAGSEVGGDDKSRAVGAVVGAVAGGLAGVAVERSVTSARGMEYTVRKQDGTLITLTQGADVIMAPGQRVFIQYGARARIVPAG